MPCLAATFCGRKKRINEIIEENVDLIKRRQMKSNMNNRNE